MRPGSRPHHFLIVLPLYSRIERWQKQITGLIADKINAIPYDRLVLTKTNRSHPPKTQQKTLYQTLLKR
jgi:hypothetical protein